ncbi:hypothetical protein WKK05_33160 [Nostoc sp. UHCC 0302]|uniref:hypothetical protein n=1 Tax=Nostoc sp. UHCC 0302 TaxID=3134896 RepID=UPI00311CD1F5
MEHWQFLIQKQDARSWHLLEWPNLEILEGEYRVLARSHLPNTDVEVRITYSSTQEVPPKRRIFKRSRRTNTEGLMAVIPFTYFKPGVWEFRCYCDLMSELVGEAWQHSVQVQVLPQKTEKENLESNPAFDTTIQSPEQPNTISDANFISTVPVEPVILNKAISLPRQLVIATQQLSENKENKEDTVIDQPVRPVWLKGETAEQILQNLIELAFPASELLPENQTVRDFSAIQPPPPLLLTLAKETYIAHWGQTLKVEGNVELKDKTNLDAAEISALNSLCALELRIDLRSPLKSEILTQVRQSLPDQVLPFTINTSIDIPAECKSKLILADISLYGGLANVNEVILASQSFTITANVTELLTITAAAKSSTSNLLADPNGVSTPPNIETESEPAFSLDLKLFNLVKTRKPDQSLIFNPSPNKPLPPQINLQVLREATLRAATLKDSDETPQLPKLPAPVQTNAIEQSAVLKAIAAADDQAIVTTAIAELPALEEPVEKAPPMAAINLEQLLIKHRRVPKVDVTFRYLRRLKALPTQAEEVEDNATDRLKSQDIEDFQPFNVNVVEDENAPQLSSLEFAADEAQSQEESVAEIAQSSAEFIEESIAQVVVQPSTEFNDETVTELVAQPSGLLSTAGNRASPLIRKWMQSQGYSLPESVNKQYETSFSVQQTPLSGNAEARSTDVNLPLQLDTDTGISLEQTPLSGSAETPSIDVNLLDTETEVNTDAHRSLSSESPDSELQEIAKEENIEVELNTEIKNIREEASLPSHPLPELPFDLPIKTLSAWLAQEIVVDDTYSEPEADTTRNQASEEEQFLSDLSLSLPTTAAIIKPLPIPQLHLPDGELPAGKSVRVRVELPDVPPQVVVKLWVEDYQTRWLLDGPHLLKNLLPNSQGGVEVLTQLNIPFGCLEIRVEAIALDPISKQESHKVTIVRTVIPPDLPTLQIDELMGM